MVIEYLSYGCRWILTVKRDTYLTHQLYGYLATSIGFEWALGLISRSTKLACTTPNKIHKSYPRVRMGTTITIPFHFTPTSSEIREIYRVVRNPITNFQEVLAS